MESIPNEVLMNILSHMRKKDLLTFRLVNSRWNETSVELVGQKIKISLIARMEAKLFMQVVRQIAGRPIFNEIKLSLDSMPYNILEELAQLLNTRCHRLRIHLFQITESQYLTPAPCVRALMILRNFPNVTFLKVSDTAKLLMDWKWIARTPVKELQTNLPVFLFLTKIIWNTDPELLLCVIQRAPKLMLLQIGNACWYDDQENKIRKIPEILKNLPPNATVNTELRLYYNIHGHTENTEDLELLTRMCQFPNKISILTLNCRCYGNTTRMNRMKQAWNPIIPQFLASQSGTLNTLIIEGRKEFNFPTLEYLENLTIRCTLPDSGFNPALLPRLKNVSVSSNAEVVKLFAPHIWWNVSCLNIDLDNAQTVRNEVPYQLATSFPLLEKISTCPALFSTFLQFFRHNYTPVEEFSISEILESDTDVIMFELTGTHGAINEKDLPGSTFPGMSSGSRGFGASTNLRKLKIGQCPLKILHALVFATRIGNLKLHTLEVRIVLEPTEYHKYWEVLSKYHETVILCKPHDHDEDGKSRAYLDF